MSFPRPLSMPADSASGGEAGPPEGASAVGAGGCITSARMAQNGMGGAGESPSHITREEMAQRIYAARYPGASFDSVTGAKRAKWLDRAERAITTR